MTKLLSYSMLIKSSKKRAKSRILQLNDRTNIPYMDMSKFVHFRLHVSTFEHKKTTGKPVASKLILIIV